MDPNLKRKLTSRKFWVALTAFISSVLVAFNIDKLTIEQVTTIVAGIGSLVCYIFAESYIDGKNASSNTSSEHYEYHETTTSTLPEPEEEAEENNEEGDLA